MECTIKCPFRQSHIERPDPGSALEYVTRCRLKRDGDTRCGVVYREPVVPKPLWSIPKAGRCVIPAAELRGYLEDLQEDIRDMLREIEDDPELETEAAGHTAREAV